ncbi:MAG: flippase [Vicinamibacteraceae bacterium]
MSRANNMLSGRALARNTLWNFTGMAIPMLVGVFAIPYLIDGMGKDRFGLLAIIWMGVGYFSFFDMGLGRALTKLVAEHLGREQDWDLAGIIWTALCLILGLGVLGMVVVLLLVEPLILHVLNVPPGLESEGIASFRLLAAGIPIVIATSALIGILEAHHRFAKIALVRVPLGVMTFLGPVVSLQFTPSLIGATSALIAARTAAFVLYYASAAQVSPSLRRPMGITRRHLRPLLSFGGWLTVSNVTGPLMVYFDRFFVGAMMSMTAVAYYVTPYEVLSRLQMLPRSVTGVLFPALTTAIAGNRARLPTLYGQALRALLLLTLPLISGAFLFAPEALQLWLGDDFRIAATPVVRWLALGWMINVLTRPCVIILQSAGRPDLVAKAHAAELCLYVILLWALTREFGIAGTASAWFFRVLVDALIMNDLTRRQVPDVRSVVMRTYLLIAAVIAGFALASLPQSLVPRALLFLATVGASVPFLRAMTRLLFRSDRTGAAAVPIAEPTR